MASLSLVRIADGLAISYNGAVNMLLRIALDQLATRRRADGAPADKPRGWEDIPLPMLGDAA